MTTPYKGSICFFPHVRQFSVYRIFQEIDKSRAEMDALKDLRESPHVSFGQALTAGINYKRLGHYTSELNRELSRRAPLN